MPLPFFYVFKKKKKHLKYFLLYFACCFHSCHVSPCICYLSVSFFRLADLSLYDKSNLFPDIWITSVEPVDCVDILFRLFICFVTSLCPPWDRRLFIFNSAAAKIVWQLNHLHPDSWIFLYYPFANIPFVTQLSLLCLDYPSASPTNTDSVLACPRQPFL